MANFDGVLVSSGENLKASLLCTLNLLSMHVHNLWVKAKTDAHHQILKSLGVNNIIHPEQDMGMRIAQKNELSDGEAIHGTGVWLPVGIPKRYAVLPKSFAKRLFSVHLIHEYFSLDDWAGSVCVDGD